MSVRDLFPPDMDAQRTAFAQALTWLFAELIAQRAEEPVAFLAQLGRDHRKYGVTPTALRQHAGRRCSPRCAAIWSTAGTTGSPRRHTDAVALIIGVMRGAADAEKGPPYCDGTVIEHIRASRDVSVVRLQLDRPMFYHPGSVRHGPGAAVAAAVALPESRRYPPTAAGPSSSTSDRSPAAWSAPPIVGETRPGDRWRLSNPHGGMQIDRDGGDVLMVAGSTGLAPLRTLIMDLTR